jgi:hypothetical protein
MKKILSFILSSFLAIGILAVAPTFPGGSGGAYASNHCVKIKVDGKVVCVKGKRVNRKLKRSQKKGNAFIGGLVGGLAGSVVGNLVTRPGPTIVVRDRGYSPEPWTPEWYDYCANKYRSFNPRTGYYWTYSGYKRFCR